MNNDYNEGLIIVDAQRGFMPVEEGQRLDVDGFGELAVPHGELVVPKLNELTQAFFDRFMPVFATQDWHPEVTAHFSETPNYVNTWPVHCRADTPGAELHPELLIETEKSRAYRYHKGSEVAKSAEDDTSYSGYLAHNVETGRSLPSELRLKSITKLYIGGLAIGDGAEHPLCVDSTAMDFKKQGLDVTVVSDATEAVLPENRARCFENLGALGIRLMTTQEVLDEITAIHGGI